MKKIKHYNIMLVEDEILLRQSLARHIDALEMGYKVVCQAPDGQTALDALASSDIHLIITDSRMPVMDGLALAKKVHDRYPHILTIVLSGYADFEYAQEALRQGVFDYLLKPVSREDLESALGKASLALEKHFQLEEDTSLAGRDSREIVDHVLLYLRNHYMDEVDFSELSSRLGFSSAYLTKLFNKYVGSTPLKYLTDIRIHEAKHLLLNTALPIREVGEKVGYPDQFHFSKTFRKLTGVNPTAYRQNPQTEKGEVPPQTVRKLDF